MQIAGTELFSIQGKQFTYAKWARSLGYSSHRAIAMVARGERFPSVDMIHRISSSLSLSLTERQYLEFLVLKERYKDRPKQLEEVERRLEKITPNQYRQQNLISPETLSLIYPWYFFAIKQLVNCEDFRMEISWIHKKLRKKVCPADIRRAISIMQQLKLIGQDPETKKWGMIKTDLVTHCNVPSETLRMHHKGMIDRAKESIDEQTVDNRFIKSLTLSFSKERMADAKKDILQFACDFNDRYGGTDSVYQLNIQFFEHTTSQLN